MIITVASGKGGTGKTTVATSLALALQEHLAVQFLDCDVEDPNAHLYLRPTIQRREEVGVSLPVVDFALCDYCGRCAEVCAYHAIAVVGQKLLIFPELCHGCGSCILNCPQKAMHEEPRPVGIIEEGQAGPIAFAQGILNVGEPMATPVIRQLKKRLQECQPGVVSILDAPPGTACPVVESLRGADFALLVTEPTPFGLHDLRLAVEVARDTLGLPVGVVINRDGVGNTGVEDYCTAEGIPVLMRIPLDRRIAAPCSDGVPLVEAFPSYREHFQDLYNWIVRVQLG
ncbi:MAG: ATP-binding protein [Chloroflexi bacterium]|nr:ATP-binding protein [Chloroflexota bacterium]